jgi:hypothetical protein
MTMRSVLGAAAAGLLLAGCGGSHAVATYRPQVREVTITAVPLLVREQAHLFPFLAADFAAGGVLEGREVYAFVPSTITAIQGDTLHLNVINPEDDLHSLVLPGLSLALPGQQTTHATYVARTPGVFAFTCNIPTHLPMMWGQLVVLSPQAVEGR